MMENEMGGWHNQLDGRQEFQNKLWSEVKGQEALGAAVTIHKGGYD